MKCNRVLRLLPAFLDGEIPAGRRAEVERHLVACRDCRQELEGLKSDLEVVRAVTTPEPGPCLVARAMAEIRQGTASGLAERHFGLRRALAAAATMLLVAGGVWAGALVGSDIAGPKNGEDLASVNSEPSLADMFGSAFAEE